MPNPHTALMVRNQPVGLTWGAVWATLPTSRAEAIKEIRALVTGLNQKKDELIQQRAELMIKAEQLPKRGQSASESGKTAAQLKQEKKQLLAELADLEKNLKAMPKQITLLARAEQEAQRVYDSYARSTAAGTAKEAGDKEKREALPVSSKDGAESSGPRPPPGEPAAVMRKRLLNQFNSKIKSEFDTVIARSFEQSLKEFDERFPGVRQHPTFALAHLRFADLAQEITRVGETSRIWVGKIHAFGSVILNSAIMLAMKNVLMREFTKKSVVDKEVLYTLGAFIALAVASIPILFRHYKFATLASDRYPLQLVELEKHVRAGGSTESLATSFRNIELRWDLLSKGGDRGEMFDMVKNDVGLLHSIIVYANMVAPKQTGTFVQALQKQARYALGNAIQDKGQGSVRDGNFVATDDLKTVLKNFCNILNNENQRSGIKRLKSTPAQNVAEFILMQHEKIAIGAKKLLDKFCADFVENQTELVQGLTGAGKQLESQSQEQAAAPEHNVSSVGWMNFNIRSASAADSGKSLRRLETAREAAKAALNECSRKFEEKQGEQIATEQAVRDLRGRIAEIDSLLNQAYAAGQSQKRDMQGEKRKVAEALKAIDEQALRWLQSNPYARALIAPAAVDQVRKRHLLAPDDDINPKKIADRLPFRKEAEQRKTNESYFLSHLDFLSTVLIAQEYLGSENQSAGAVAVPCLDEYVNCGRIIGTAYRRTTTTEQLDACGVDVSMDENYVIAHIHPHVQRFWESAD